MDNSNPIRVLEVVVGMNRAGAENMIMNLYRKIDRSKIQLDFVVHTTNHCHFDDEIEQLGGRLFHMPHFYVLNFFSYRRAWRLFFQEHPEISIVHGHVGSTAAIYLHEANRAGRFTIAHSHSAGTSIRSLNDLLFTLFSYPTRYIAKQFFGCSTEAGIKRYGQKVVHGLKYKNFPNAIDLTSFIFDSECRCKKRKELGIQDNCLVAIHVGRMTSAKNPHMIYEIFKEIVRINKDAICLWVGTGELEEKYRNKINREGLQNKILMTGVRSDIPQLLMASDVFLFPSLWEGLPVSVVEAQAAGIPCVISKEISKEVELCSLVEWHDVKESPSVWAERCLLLAEQYQVKRKSPIEDIRRAGYDIEDSVKRLSDFYISKSLS